jgi:hypothetical protein
VANQSDTVFTLVQKLQVNRRLCVLVPIKHGNPKYITVPEKPSSRLLKIAAYSVRVLAKSTRYDINLLQLAIVRFALRFRHAVWHVRILGPSKRQYGVENLFSRFSSHDTRSGYDMIIMMPALL